MSTIKLAMERKKREKAGDGGEPTLESVEHIPVSSDDESSPSRPRQKNSRRDTGSELVSLIREKQQNRAGFQQQIINTLSSFNDKPEEKVPSIPIKHDKKVSFISNTHTC